MHRFFVRWHGVGVGVDSAAASARSGVGQSVGPGLGIQCNRRRRRERLVPRRGRRFQLQVPARPRVSAEITVCRVGQPSALLTRCAQLHDSLGFLRVHGVLGYGSKHALWLWSAPSPTFEQMMHGPSSAPEAVRRVRHGGVGVCFRREAVDGLAPASYSGGAAFCMRAHIGFPINFFQPSRRWIGNQGLDALSRQ